MAAVYASPGGGGPALTGTDGTPEIVPSQTVTARFFDVFGVRPLLGRTFREADEIAGPDVAVIGESLWRSRFGADPSIVGRAFVFDGRPITILGVVPADFQFLQTAGMWTLYPRPREDRGRRLFAGLLVVARLKPASGADAAQSELAVLADRLARDHGDDRTGAARYGVADARLPRRRRAPANVDAVLGRRRLRPAPLLRQRCQPAAGAGVGACAGDGRAIGAWVPAGAASSGSS